MDAQHFREKAEVLLRLANGLSLNNLGRFQLTVLAEDLRKRARELDAQTTLQPQRSQSENVEYRDGRSQMSEPDIQDAPLLQVQTD
jgi:hypothetical protein